MENSKPAAMRPEEIAALAERPGNLLVNENALIALILQGSRELNELLEATAGVEHLSPDERVQIADALTKKLREFYGGLVIASAAVMPLPSEVLAAAANGNIHPEPDSVN